MVIRIVLFECTLVSRGSVLLPAWNCLAEFPVKTTPQARKNGYVIVPVYFFVVEYLWGGLCLAMVGSCGANVACLSEATVVTALLRPPVQQSLQDMLPNIELSLVLAHLLACLHFLSRPYKVQAPPQHPWPQVAAELGNLEESREHIENANMDRLQREMNKALLEARRQIGDTIGRAMRAFDDPRMAGAVQISRLC